MGMKKPPPSLLPPCSLQPQADVQLPGSVGVDLLLGISEDLAIYLLRPASHTNSLRFDVATLQRKRTSSSERKNALHLDVEFTDYQCDSVGGGSDATALGAMARKSGPEVLYKLSSRTSYFDAYHESVDQWHLFPLPSLGDLVFICECPAFGVAKTHTRLSGDVVRQAAARARPLWG